MRREPKTFLDAAIRILEDSDDPLNAREIMKEIRERNLISFSGKTPVSTLSAALYRNLGKEPRLQKVAVPGGKRAKSGSVRWYVTRAHNQD